MGERKEDREGKGAITDKLRFVGRVAAMVKLPKSVVTSHQKELTFAAHA
jgi:hypothetical protein